MDIPDVAGIKKQKPDTKQHSHQKCFPFPVLPDKKRKPVSFQQRHLCMGLPYDRPKLAESVEGQIHLIGVSPGHQSPDQDLVIPAQIQETLRGIALNPDLDISAYVTKDCLYHRWSPLFFLLFLFWTFTYKIPENRWFR
jgi:hypothetical protein